jgi:hypothetical protein
MPVGWTLCATLLAGWRVVGRAALVTISGRAALGPVLAAESRHERLRGRRDVGERDAAQRDVVDAVSCTSAPLPAAARTSSGSR